LQKRKNQQKIYAFAIRVPIDEHNFFIPPCPVVFTVFADFQRYLLQTYPPAIHFNSQCVTVKKNHWRAYKIFRAFSHPLQNTCGVTIIIGIRGTDDCYGNIDNTMQLLSSNGKPGMFSPRNVFAQYLPTKNPVAYDFHRY
jgi:hypothetical protein